MIHDMTKRLAEMERVNEEQRKKIERENTGLRSNAIFGTPSIRSSHTRQSAMFTQRSEWNDRPRETEYPHRSAHERLEGKVSIHSRLGPTIRTSPSRGEIEPQPRTNSTSAKEATVGKIHHRDRESSGKRQDPGV